MAWKKSFSRFGKQHKDCYWRLTGLTFDFKNKSAQLTFHGYLDEDAANDPTCEAIGVVCIPLSQAEYDAWAKVDGFQADAYELSASDDAFVGAVEV